MFLLLFNAETAEWVWMKFGVETYPGLTYMLVFILDNVDKPRGAASF